MLQTEVLFVQFDWLYGQRVYWAIVCGKGKQFPSVFLHFEDTYSSLTACWIQLNAVCSRCPFHMVYRAFVMLMFCDLNPLVVLILENCDFFLETADCNQLSKLRISPWYFPDCRFVALLWGCVTLWMRRTWRSYLDFSGRWRRCLRSLIRRLWCHYDCTWDRSVINEMGITISALV